MKQTDQMNSNHGVTLWTYNYISITCEDKKKIGPKFTALELHVFES